MHQSPPAAIDRPFRLIYTFEQDGSLFESPPLYTDQSELHYRMACAYARTKIAYRVTVRPKTPIPCPPDRQ